MRENEEGEWKSQGLILSHSSPHSVFARGVVFCLKVECKILKYFIILDIEENKKLYKTANVSWIISILT